VHESMMAIMDQLPHALGILSGQLGEHNL